MDVDSNIILHTETIDKRQVDLQSPNMERKAFIKSMDFLLSTIRCSEVITDASSSIRKTLGTYYYFRNLLIINTHRDQVPHYISLTGCLAQN